MKKMILFSITTLISISSFAVSRADIEYAFTFLYSKSSETSSLEQKQAMADLYLAILRMQTKCLSGELSHEFCNSTSISAAALKMESIYNIQARIIDRVAHGETRTPEMIEQINALETQRNTLGESLVSTVTGSLSKLSLK